MRVSFFLWVSFFLISDILLRAQLFDGMLTGGLNFTQVDGDELIGYRKIGFHGGPGVRAHMGGKWYFSLETIFNQKGSYKKYPQQWDDSMKLPYYKLTLNYADVVCLVHYDDKALWFGAGFSAGRLGSMREIERGKIIPWAYSNMPYRKMDYNVIVSVMFRIKDNLFFNFRYAYSMRYIRVRNFVAGNNQWTRYQYNNMLTCKLIYFLPIKLNF
ncbi:MAG: PorT family protein [Bacteroidales bacterium]|nr:PorT family protein [Bacteroidales bacterium]